MKTTLTIILVSAIIVSAQCWPTIVANNSFGSIQQPEIPMTTKIKMKMTTTTTSTTTPPSVLFPPKRYFLFDSPKPSPAINTHHIHHHHHSVIKLPKIQIHKVYYTAESAPPMTLVKPERQENFRKEMKKNSGDRKNSDINLVANETQRFTEVDSGERHSSSQSQLHYDPISDHHHHHPHQDGYNPSVLEESEEGEEALLQQSAPPNDDPSVSSLEAGYGMPQIPPPLYDSEHHQGDHGFDHHHDHHHPPQILPPEALKQVLQPTLSSEMLDDELAQINRQIITGYQNNRDSFEQYLKKMNYHAKAVIYATKKQYHSFTVLFVCNLTGFNLSRWQTLSLALRSTSIQTRPHCRRHQHQHQHLGHLSEKASLRESSTECTEPLPPPTTPSTFAVQFSSHPQAETVDSSLTSLTASAVILAASKASQLNCRFQPPSVRCWRIQWSRCTTSSTHRRRPGHQQCD